MVFLIKKAHVASFLLVLLTLASTLSSTVIGGGPDSRSASSSTLEKNRNLANFCACIERILCERFKEIEKEVERNFCEENVLIKSAIDAFNLALREFFAAQLDISEASIKDFIICRLDKLEENIEGFFCHKAGCLQNVFATQFQFINCELRNLITLAENVDSSTKCFATNLLGYLQAANTVGNAESNPLRGTLDEVIASTQLCIDASDDCDTIPCLNTSSEPCFPVVVLE